MKQVALAPSADSACTAVLLPEKHTDCFALHYFLRCTRRTLKPRDGLCWGHYLACRKQCFTCQVGRPRIRTRTSRPFEVQPAAIVSRLR
jgi:hypothetical protein